MSYNSIQLFFSVKMRHIETKNPVKSHTVVEFIAVTNVAIFAQHYFVVHLFIYRHFQHVFSVNLVKLIKSTISRKKSKNKQIDKIALILSISSEVYRQL